jgi:hypothetical protein
MERKLEISGKVEFHRSELKPGESYCICCGDPKVPHAHIYGEDVAFPRVPSLYAGLYDSSINNYLHRFIHMNGLGVEGKTIKVTFEVVE